MFVHDVVCMGEWVTDVFKTSLSKTNILLRPTTCLYSILSLVSRNLDSLTNQPRNLNYRF